MGYIGTTLGIIAGIAGVAMLFSIFFMWLGAKMILVENATFGRSFLAAIGSVFFTWVASIILAIILPIVGMKLGFLLGLILTIFFIQRIYKTTFGKACLVWVFHILAEAVAILLAILTFAGAFIAVVI